MSYCIAVASSDGQNIDQSFGEARTFLIYEVNSDGFHVAENRYVADDGLVANRCSSSNCTPKNGGCSSVRKNGGCNGELPGIALVADCRAVIASRIGFNAVKQLEKKAIATFDVECPIEEALSKITEYFRRVDAHESLRGIRNSEGKDKNDKF